jgi:hypothetical protein
MSGTLLTPGKVTLPRFSLRMAPVPDETRNLILILFIESMVVALYTPFLLHVNVRSFNPALHTRYPYHIFLNYIQYTVSVTLRPCLFSNIVFFAEFVIWFGLYYARIGWGDSFARDVVA